MTSLRAGGVGDKRTAVTPMVAAAVFTAGASSWPWGPATPRGSGETVDVHLLSMDPRDPRWHPTPGLDVPRLAVPRRRSDVRRRRGPHPGVAYLNGVRKTPTPVPNRPPVKAE
ncbi:MAG: hypothetical protein ABJC62_02780 [Frankiaceae bacterium]